jgi:hypothetical protein
MMHSASGPEFGNTAGPARPVDRSGVDVGSFVFPAHHAHQRAGFEDTEDAYRHLLVAAQRECGRVHHLEPLGDGLVEADPRIPLGSRIARRVGGVDAVDLGRLEHHLGTDLGSAQRGGRVRGEERISRPAGEDHRLALFEILQRLGAHVRLDDLLDRDRRHHPGIEAGMLHRIGKRQRIHHRRQHAHVVGRGPVHPHRSAGDAAEDVAPADDDRKLHPRIHHLGEVAHHVLDGRTVDAEGVVAHQGLARELEQYAFVGGHVHSGQGEDGWIIGAGLGQASDSDQPCLAAAICAATSSAKFSDFFSMPSPTTYIVKPCTVVLAALSIWATVCLSFFTNA